MRPRSLCRAALAALLALPLAGCLLMPKHGTPVYVDAFAGDFWSGEGLLLEVTPDQTRCRVAVRDRALIVRTLWVACRSVHPRSQRARG
jgi:hypothetical protein